MVTAGAALTVLNHDEGTTTYTWKVPTAAVTTAPKAANPTYTGQLQKLVTEGAASNGAMQYATGSDSTAEPTAGWSSSIPTASDVGTYYVWYKAKGNTGYADSEPVCVTVSISRIYNVNYYVDDSGGSQPFTQKTSEGGEFTFPTFDSTGLAKPTGKDFDGWELGSVTFKPNDTYTVSADTDVYAVWVIPGPSPDPSPDPGPASTARDRDSDSDSGSSAPSYPVSGGGDGPALSAELRRNAATVQAPTSSQLARISGDAAKGEEIAVDLSGLPAAVSAAILPAALVETVAEAAKANGEASLRVKLSRVEVTFDAGEISAYAVEALRWAVGSGLASGRTAVTLNPGDSANRAEVATIMMRFCTEMA